MLQNNPTLKSLIDKLWNNFWSGGIANPLTAIEQITYLLFMKQLDKNETIAERNVTEGYIEEKDYNFRFKGKYQPPGTTKEKDAIDKNEYVGVCSSTCLPRQCSCTFKQKCSHFFVI